MKFSFEENKPKKGILKLEPENEIDIYEIGRFIARSHSGYEISISNTKKKVNYLSFEIDRLWTWMKTVSDAD